MCCLCSSECLSISCWCSIICFQCNGVKESPRPRQLYSLILPAKLLLTAVSLFEIQIHGGNFLGWYICYTGETNSPQVHIWKFSFTLSRFNCLVSCLSMWSSLGSVQVHMSLWIPARLNDILKITLKSWSGVSHPHFPFFHPSVLSLFCILSTLPMHHIPEWPPRCHHSNFYPCFPTPPPRPHLCPLCILSAYGCSNSFATPAAARRNPRVGKEKAVARRPPDGKQHCLCSYVKTDNNQKQQNRDRQLIEHFHLLGHRDVVAVHHGVGLHNLLVPSWPQATLAHWEDHIFTADQVIINL